MTVEGLTRNEELRALAHQYVEANARRAEAAGRAREIDRAIDEEVAKLTKLAEELAKFVGPRDPHRVVRVGDGDVTVALLIRYVDSDRKPTISVEPLV